MYVCTQARDAGKVTTVGVSNFGPAQIEGLRAAECELPEVITLAECLLAYRERER